MFQVVVITARGREYRSSIYTIENTGGVAIDSKTKLRDIVERIVFNAREHGVYLEAPDGKMFSIPAESIDHCTYVETS